MLGLESRLLGKRDSLRVHGVIATGAIQQGVKNQPVGANAHPNLRRGQRQWTAEDWHWGRMNDDAVFQNPKNAKNGLVHGYYWAA